MSEQRPIPPRDVSPEGPSHNRRIPPLVWVILALVFAVLAIGTVGGFNMNHTEQAKAASTAT
jgi:hypothetical protein